MSQCNCTKLDDATPPRQVWCDIHKEKPLTIPEQWCVNCFVIRTYEHPWVRKWHAELARDAMQVQVTELFDTKQEAINAINLSPSSHVHHNTAPGEPSGSMIPVEQTHPGQPCKPTKQ